MEDEKLKEILERHSRLIREELNAVYGKDCGFILTIAKNNGNNGVLVKHSGNMEKQLACEIFAAFLESHDESVGSFRQSGARAH